MFCCFWKSKIQILKAIHNNGRVGIVWRVAVSESQRYKFWKQFTTIKSSSNKTGLLFLKVKDTNFESNSQRKGWPLPTNRRLFLKVKDTNFESNSQLVVCITAPAGSCFWKSKIQILKAIHNYHCRQINIKCAVSESQRYKFWKQFTTPIVIITSSFRCFWKSKIQILKAIHN